jgi:DNA-binding HxlR family transcriptional regulator
MVAAATTRFDFRTKSFDLSNPGGLQAAPVVDFRYAQFCPLTRAVEILGERWTILILRELFLGPKRFSDLKSALNGVSPSVLADRLAKLEERGLVTRRELAPPAALAVYELDEAGRAVRPLLVEMMRWGMRFLGAPGPGDRVRPEWLLLGFQAFASARASDDIGVLLRVEDGIESMDIYVRGGAGGTVVSGTPADHDVVVSAPPVEMLMFTSGFLAPDASQALRFEGDADIVRAIPSLFEFQPTPEPAAPARDLPPTDHAPAGRPARRRLKAAAGSGHPGGAGL